MKQSLQSYKVRQHTPADTVSDTCWRPAWVLPRWISLTISFGYKLAIRSFSGDTFEGSRQ